MYLSKLALKNFRNYPALTVEFSPHTNVLIGQNAQGKTNLLEALYYLALARSHRTTNERELISFRQEFATVAGTVHTAVGTTQLELQLQRHGKKAKVNHLEQKRLSTYIGQMNVILFAPEDLNLIKGGPALRRRFIDMEFGQIDAQYLAALTRYRTVLKQRNKYLKLLQHRQDQDKLYLQVLSEQLAELGGVIVAKRLGFLHQLQQYANQVQQAITQEKEQLRFEYVSGTKNLVQNLADEKNSVAQDGQLAMVALSQRIETQLLTQLTALADKEIAQGTTLLGPHRDDLRVLLNGRNVQVYGSQGQQRTTVLALKLAEIDVMKAQTGEYPILLLDDVLSELDGQRQTQLLHTIQTKVQTFLTSPALSDVAQQLIATPRVFTVAAGTLRGQGVIEGTPADRAAAKVKAQQSKAAEAKLVEQAQLLAQRRKQHQIPQRTVRFFPHGVQLIFPAVHQRSEEEGVDFD